MIGLLEGERGVRGIEGIRERAAGGEGVRGREGC